MNKQEYDSRVDKEFMQRWNVSKKEVVAFRGTLAYKRRLLGVRVSDLWESIKISIKELLTIRG